MNEYSVAGEREKRKQDCNYSNLLRGAGVAEGWQGTDGEEGTEGEMPGRISHTHYSDAHPCTAWR